MKQSRRAAAGADDRGTGLVAAAFGLLVTILFLTLAVQLTVGLYATTTLRATLHEAASQAANHAGHDPGELTRIAREAEASLGRTGERSTIVLEPVDVDGDGRVDLIAGEAAAVLPRVVPRSLGGMLGFEEIKVGVNVRVERPR